MSIRVLRPGPQALLQDAGRPDYLRDGVARSGAFDRTAWRVGNLLLNNSLPADALTGGGPASIEIVLGGFECEAIAPITLAISGADCGLRIIPKQSDNDRTLDTGELSNEKTQVPPARDGQLIQLSNGDRLRLGRPRFGLRTYISTIGGFSAPQILGSRSTDVVSGLGPPAISAGDVLAAEPQSHQPAISTIDNSEGNTSQAAQGALGSSSLTQPAPSPDSQSSTTRLIVHRGPDWELFDLAAADQRMHGWTVSPASNRAGVRLIGTTDPEANKLGADKSVASGASIPTVPGTIQLLPDGDLVVFGPDGPTSGGYPVIGVLDEFALNCIAQLRPGQPAELVDCGANGRNLPNACDCSPDS